MLAPLRDFYLQPKGFFRRARGRIYVAFGQHPAVGVCVCVCSSKLDSSGFVVWLLGFRLCNVCMGVFVSLFACLLLRVSFYFLGWLVVCVYVLGAAGLGSVFFGKNMLCASSIPVVITPLHAWWQSVHSGHHQNTRMCLRNREPAIEIDFVLSRHRADHCPRSMIVG